MLGDTWRPRRRLRFQVLATIYALIGGALATALVFAGLSFGAFAIGLAAMAGLVMVTAMRSGGMGALTALVVYSLALMLLIWPVLLLVAAALWGRWQ